LVQNYRLAVSSLSNKYRRQCLSKALAEQTFGFNLSPELLHNVKDYLLLKSSLRIGEFSVVIALTYGWYKPCGTANKPEKHSC